MLELALTSGNNHTIAIGISLRWCFGGRLSWQLLDPARSSEEVTGISYAQALSCHVTARIPKSGAPSRTRNTPLRGLQFRAGHPGTQLVPINLC